MSQTRSEPSGYLHSEGILEHTNRSFLHVEICNRVDNGADRHCIFMFLRILYFLPIGLRVKVDALELNPFVAIEANC
jgi:hypothetical protein